MTRKVSRSVAQIHLGYMESVSSRLLGEGGLLTWCTQSLFSLWSSQFKLGNLDAKRDWGHAKDYVEVHNNDFTT